MFMYVNARSQCICMQMIILRFQFFNMVLFILEIPTSKLNLAPHSKFLIAFFLSLRRLCWFWKFIHRGLALFSEFSTTCFIFLQFVFEAFLLILDHLSPIHCKLISFFESLTTYFLIFWSILETSLLILKSLTTTHCDFSFLLIYL